jgi:hypothetical protein
MKMFAIINVELDCDYVDKVTCVTTFKDEVQAIEYISRCRAEDDETFTKWLQYAQNFVRDFDVPKYTNHEEWQVFIKKIFGYLANVIPSNFHTCLLSHLGQGNGNIEGYNPPPRPGRDSRNWRVAEINYDD